MEQHCETSDIFYLSAQTQWLPPEKFTDINNWDDSLKSSALYYIQQAEGWMGSNRDAGEFAKNVSCAITNPVKKEENATIPTTITNLIGVDRPKPFECRQCGKSFDYNSLLTRHLRTHSEEKQFECSQCGKTFTQKGSLTIHLRIHSGERPYACSQCEKTFADKSNMTRHLRIHSGEKPYICCQCGKAFFHLPCLTRHLRTHSGVKPYECSQCGKSFADKSNMTRHLRIHSGESPSNAVNEENMGSQV